MRLGVRVLRGPDWRLSVEKVRIAEQLGYEMVVAVDPGIVPWLTILATHTERILLGSSIVNVYPRSPALLAQDFAALDEISGGRAVLGIGVSSPQLNEQYHGVRFERPLRRLREYVEIVNLLFSGRELVYDGEIFRMDDRFRLTRYASPPRDHIPIWIGAVSPPSIRQTGEVADGIIPVHWPREHFGTLRAELEEGAGAAGRAGFPFTIAPQTHVYVLDGRRDEELWWEARRPIWQYINRMGPFYWPMLARLGFEAEVEASRAAWARRDRDGSLAAISERMVRSIQVIGPIESVREQLRERARLGADLQLLYTPEIGEADYDDPAAIGRRLESYLG